VYAVSIIQYIVLIGILNFIIQVVKGLNLLANVTSDIQHDKTNLEEGDIVCLFK